MKANYLVHYENENEFNKLSRSLRKYNMLAYKDFIFNLVDKLRKGELIGEKQEDNTYRCYLKSNDIFEFVYGKSYFVYRVENHVVTLITIEPKDFLKAGHARQLETYKGVPIIGPRERFKIDVYLSLYNK